VRAPQLPAGRTIELGGRGDAFVRHVPAPDGAPTVLLLHGLGITSDVQWFTVLPALAERYGVLALDHRGHGRGIRGSGAFTLEDCADDAAAALAALEIDRAVVVGYSMGSPVAQLVWRRHPERTAALILCAGVHSYRGMEPARSRFPAVGSLVTAARTARALARVVDPDLRAWLLRDLWRTDRRYAYDAGQALGAYDASAWLAGVDVPHAVVVTENDGVVPPERQRRVAEALPSPSVHPCPADHVDVLRASNGFTPALLDALAAVTAQLP
jgi:pimeloyl-ACP methyl ester carboxylesterase